MEFTEEFFHPKANRRIDRLMRLDERSGEKYCWASLVVDIGMRKLSADEVIDAKDNCRTGGYCKRDSIKEETCWCHKFENGHLKTGETK